MTTAAFFEPGPDGYVPTKWAVGRWSKDTLHGPAVVALAVRELERACIDSDDFQPARVTVDLFKAAKLDPITVQIETLRDGRRIRVAEARLIQNNAIVSRTLLVLLRKSAPPPGSEWSRPELPVAPPSDSLAMIGGTNRSRIGLIGSDDTGWTDGTGSIQNASRKRLWATLPAAVVPGEELSPFQRAAIAAESTSLITNLGTDGIGYINADLTVGLARLPKGDKVGLEADTHWTADGISVGTATLFDEDGPFGTGMVVAVNNSAAQIDFSKDKPGERVVRD